MMETYIGKTISDFTLQSSDGQTISLNPNPPIEDVRLAT